MGQGYLVGSVGVADNTVHHAKEVLVGRFRCRADLEHMSQSRPDSGLGFYVNVLTCPMFAREGTLSEVSESPTTPSILAESFWLARTALTFFRALASITCTCLP